MIRLSLLLLAGGLLVFPAVADHLYWTVDFDDEQSEDDVGFLPATNPTGNNAAKVWLMVVDEEGQHTQLGSGADLSGSGAGGGVAQWQSQDVSVYSNLEQEFWFYVAMGEEVGKVQYFSEWLTYDALVAKGYIRDNINALPTVWNPGAGVWTAPTVPEPSSGLLCLLGGALLALRRRRRVAVALAVPLMATMLACGTVGAEVAPEPNCHAIDVANVVGVTRIESAADYLPLVVQYGRVAVARNAPQTISGYVTNLVFTANLAEGDMLYAYDHGKGLYRAFTLTADKQWSALMVWAAGMSADDAAIEPDMNQDWGYGFWLHRPNASARADQNVYLAGQVPVGSVSVTVMGSADGVRGKTLIGNPFHRGWDLNDKASFDWTGKAAKFDTIQLDGNPATIFQYNGSTWVKKTGALEGTTIPIGRCFWYQRAKTATDDIDIDFGSVLNP